MTDQPSPTPLLGPPRESLERLLDEGSAFVPPSRALEALSAEVACQRVETSPHSVAEIVAHMVFWQGYTLARARRADDGAGARC